VHNAAMRNENSGWGCHDYPTAFTHPNTKEAGNVNIIWKYLYLWASVLQMKHLKSYLMNKHLQSCYCFL